MKKYKGAVISLLVILLSVMLAGCSSREQTTGRTELLISAAASLKDSLTEIKAKYEQENDGVTLTLNFGGSGALQQQIEQGAPADLFLSAGKKQMEALVGKQLVEAGQQTNLLTNELVLVVAADSKLKISGMEDLSKPEIKKLALGEPDTVPAGGYSREMLLYYGLWDTLQPKIVQAKDVRQVLSYVETGNAEAGFVYQTDAISSPKVKTVFKADPDSYTPIEYPAGIVKATKHMETARHFYNYLQSAPAQDIFQRHGFSLPGQT